MLYASWLCYSLTGYSSIFDWPIPASLFLEDFVNLLTLKLSHEFAHVGKQGFENVCSLILLDCLKNLCLQLLPGWRLSCAGSWLGVKRVQTPLIPLGAFLALHIPLGAFQPPLIPLGAFAFLVLPIRLDEFGPRPILLGAFQPLTI